MSIRVLGCSGSIAAGSRTTAFLVDTDILIDAGTGVGDLTLDEMACVDHIFLTHSHLDHVLAVGLLADSVLRLRRDAGRPPIQVHALPATLDALKAHVFNGVLWPDFTALPDHESPVLKFLALDVGERIQLGRRTLEVLPAVHTVPAVGFAMWCAGVRATGAAWVFTGDTGPNPALWERLNAMEIKSLVIETAFRDDEHDVARRSAHLHPALLIQELRNLKTPTDVFVTHVKPGEVSRVMGEIATHPSHHRLHVLAAGDQFAFAAPAN